VPIRTTKRIPAGACVLVTGEGPADGRWIVHGFRQDQFASDGQATLTLGWPEAPKARATSTVRLVTGQAPDADDADATGTGSVKPAPGNGSYAEQTTRTDGKRVLPHQWLTAFLRLLSDRVGDTLYTNTYSRHSQLSSSGLESDHWNGNAADINVTQHGGNYPNPYGTRIAQEALRMCGVSLQDARHLAGAGGSYVRRTWRYQGRSYSVQILWGPNVGHTDHVHIGVRPA
jgi:hypothetical protein